MLEILQNLDIDWMTVLPAIWTIIFVPIGQQILEYLKSKKLDGYAIILYDEVVKSVKSVNQAVVDDIKGTEGWDEETKEYVKELCKTKVTQALSTIVYRSLKEANEDFNEYLDNLIETAIYDIKHEKK